MKTLQDTFFTALDALAARHDCAVVLEQNYSNTGLASICRDGFDEVLRFRYAFQAGHNVFRAVNEEPIFAREAGRNPAMMIVGSPGEMQPCLDLIEQAVRTRLTDREIAETRAGMAART